LAYIVGMMGVNIFFLFYCCLYSKTFIGQEQHGCVSGLGLGAIPSSLPDQGSSQSFVGSYRLEDAQGIVALRSEVAVLRRQL
jgi:hypothetical protein